MKPTLLSTLKKLMALHTPSGSESEGINLIADYVRDSADELHIDVHGNLHAVINPKAKKAVVLDAHCDEIGFLVQHVDNSGFVYLTAIGGVPTSLLPGARVVINGSNGPVYGVFGVRPPHLEESGSGKSSMKDFPLDIGASSKAEALKLIQPGDAAVMDVEWRDLAGDRVTCRGFDNRVGVFIVAQAFKDIAKLKPKVSVHLLISVCEEIGLVGASGAVSQIKAEVGICVDVGFASDTPDADKRISGDISLGHGPIVNHGPLYNTTVVKGLCGVAAKNKIPFQRGVRSRANTNNAWPMRIYGNYATSLISIPLRYMHSPVETISLADVDSSIKLISTYISTLK